MLKTINPLLTGDLLAILSDMGHGDEIVIVDANFPAAATAQRLVRLPAASATEALDAVLSLLPLDDFVDTAVAAMDAPDGRPAIYAEFDALLSQHEGRSIDIELIGRFDFYERTRRAYAVVATGERRLYANVALKKVFFAFELFRSRCMRHKYRIVRLQVKNDNRSACQGC